MKSRNGFLLKSGCSLKACLTRGEKFFAQQKTSGDSPRGNRYPECFQERGIPDTVEELNLVWQGYYRAGREKSGGRFVAPGAQLWERGEGETNGQAQASGSARDCAHWLVPSAAPGNEQVKGAGAPYGNGTSSWMDSTGLEVYPPPL